MILLIVSVLGVGLFLWPLSGLWAPPDLPVLAAVCAAILVLGAGEHSARRLDGRRLALLATLAAVNTALRMVMTTGIAGFSPVFFLIICAGYVVGPAFGFLTGTLTLLVSGIATGGVGAWLPYEMLAAGWSGMVAGVAGTPRRGRTPSWTDIAVLAVVAGIIGFAYGAVMDIWDWSLRGASPGIGWQPGLSPADEVTRFAHFYVVTSLAWDAFRAVGTAALVVLAGQPVMIALHRVNRRWRIHWIDEPSEPVAA